MDILAFVPEIRRQMERAEREHPEAITPENLAPMLEEVGEVAKAINEGDTSAEAEELYHVIVTALRLLESVEGQKNEKQA